MNVFVFPIKVHRRSASIFFLSQKHKRALNFRLDFLINKGKVGVLIHNIFDGKSLQVYFTLYQDNFILVDVISMWDMSFVFKNV